jgi:DNA repair protein REV1
MSVVAAASQSNSSDYYDFDDDNSQFLAALETTTLPGDLPLQPQEEHDHEIESDHEKLQDEHERDEFELPPPSQYSLKRRRSPTPEPRDDERVDPVDDTYGAANFGQFGEYMRRKRAKLQIQNAQIGSTDENPKIFKDLSIYVRTLWTRR